MHHPRLGGAGSGAVWFELVDHDGYLTSTTASIEVKLPANGTATPAEGTVVDVTGTLSLQGRDFRHLLLGSAVSATDLRGRLSADVRRGALSSHPSLRPEAQEKLKARRPAPTKLDGVLADDRGPVRVTFLGPRTSSTRADIKDSLPKEVVATWADVNFWRAEDIAEAITAVAARDADLLVVHRGGGGWRDWIALDDVRVLGAVADCAVPVVTAIGHASDRVAISWVAAASFITPTAVGAALRRRAARLGYEPRSASAVSAVAPAPAPAPQGSANLAALVERCLGAEAAASARALAAEREASARIAEIRMTAGQHHEAEAEARRAAAEARRLVVQAERSFALHRIQVRAITLGLVAAVSTVVVAHGLPAWLPADPWYASAGSALAALTAGTAGTVFLFRGRSRALTPPRRIREGMPEEGEDAWLFALRHAQSPRRYRRLHGSSEER
ncbi:exodeoxyribonuclease VII large subunit [Clavibacter michiganensis]|uniref:exodeoxyribonuclease VII large subunit n=1 Tax=Clavibacter michiganensis TaxID=28447 RepID=UPI00195E1304|nr:exodeoxyribonuclease VII large subunit [Clavibacter michiganensis]MBM7411231.1 exodeoxyribonuclease VII large subunit [Clavibacter michiganensis]